MKNQMLTLFTIPKPFRDHFADIQENAIRSWTRLGTGARVVLLGDDPGTGELANRLRVEHLPNIRRNQYGTPLLDDAFRQAEESSTDPHLCYVNADILLGSDFLRAVKMIRQFKRRFLMVGQRTDFDQNGRIDFSDQSWESNLRKRVAKDGALHRPTGIDYFVYQRGMWGTIPPFAIGRFSWDNWLIYRALQLKISVVDATSQVLAVHQNHDYSHARNGSKGARRGPESRENFHLAGGLRKSFTIWDSTHVLVDSGLKPRTFDAALGGGIWSYRRNVVAR